MMLTAPRTWNRHRAHDRVGGLRAADIGDADVRVAMAAPMERDYLVTHRRGFPSEW